MPDQTFEAMGSCRLVVEQEVPFDCEVSVVVARGADGAVADHGVMENVHVDGILDTTVTPARLPAQVAGEARRLAARLAEHLDVVGVLCVEMFVVGTDLIVNEMAPRPHNSGHCTIEAASASQFEQQLRAVCGLPLGDGGCRPAAMAQLLGHLWADGEPSFQRALADPGLHLHVYGKRDARPGRKMGHLTCVDSTPEIALKRVSRRGTGCDDGSGSRRLAGGVRGGRGVHARPPRARTAFFGLYTLQHRGQESAGIVSCDEGTAHMHRGPGLVGSIFNEENLSTLRGPAAIGHTATAPQAGPGCAISSPS